MTEYRPTPKSFRLHIGIFGRRNAGKSALLNMLTRQQVSIVSDVAGTTTDPVEKPMEMLPLGPVLFIDTAGVDDEGALGAMRVKKTRQVLDRTDLALLVVDSDRWGVFEEQLLAEFHQRRIPVIVVFNKVDVARPDATLLAQLDQQKIPYVFTAAIRHEGLESLRQALIQNAPEDFINSPPLIADLVQSGQIVVLVVPIDKEAPKGRLIQPQVLTLRELLDHGALAMVCRDSELARALESLKEPPVLVVTDSQAFAQVARVTPPHVKMTSFSILLARQKGDLNEFVRGALAIDRLRPGDHVLVAESCSHHPIADDIGREKIPRWLQERVGGKLHFTTVQGHDFPEDLSPYRLLVHCGACMWNRREVLTRMELCRRAGVPICNYGVTIAYTLGILDRALEPFPEAQRVYRELTRSAPVAT
ncbi:[FeFe]-hydrogenase maturation protein HydF [Thermogutta terrifontis]|uniref:[FeFe]-hydrogenase maturation protein HydF n=1 Tax=Thermogutta terrifontis TaxID=1331910 RepID=A0A286RLQ6_9BACT|nr:[FeFe] hydrogenase H-cluster maturation GTPase HydF [Thermogutta terrifontis]ASV76837.1 [FeFe]-hydrogenase maturation protein HydF [Thermogutta terrifontis]